MSKKKLYLKIKNGNKVEIFHRVNNNNISYTIRIEHVNNKIQLHTYYFDGNDISNEKNYKNEQIRYFTNFNSLIDVLEIEFPNLKIE